MWSYIHSWWHLVLIENIAQLKLLSIYWYYNMTVPAFLLTTLFLRPLPKSCWHQFWTHKSFLQLGKSLTEGCLAYVLEQKWTSHTPMCSHLFSCSLLSGGRHKFKSCLTALCQLPLSSSFSDSSGFVDSSFHADKFRLFIPYMHWSRPAHSLLWRCL